MAGKRGKVECHDSARRESGPTRGCINKMVACLSVSKQNRNMLIEYDDTKNVRNLRERGLSFDRAGDFDFNTAIIDQDTRRHYPEPRFVALGFLEGRLHVLCFTPKASGIRVISFRKANTREIRRHERTAATD